MRSLPQLLVVATALLADATAFAQEAAAEAAPAAKTPGLWETLMLPAGFLLIMYFMIMRPQQKKAREQQEFLAKLKAGDEVVTSGGIIGRVRTVADTFVTLEVSGNTTMKVLKSHVSLLPKEPTPAAAKEQPAKV
jgi:preprotein translocase subunit YajC